MTEKDLQHINKIKEFSISNGLNESATINLIEIFGKLNASPSLDNIWHKTDNAISYWLLLMNGINSQQEAKIATEILFWREFLVGDDAQVRCIQSSERDNHKMCVKHFSVSNPPVLIFSKDPLFTSSIKIDSDLLKELVSKEDGLRNFVNNIHIEILRGKTFKEIAISFGTGKLWKNIKLGYKEIKGFFTISIEAKA